MIATPNASVVCQDTTKVTRDEWLGMRRTGIGGSDAAAVCRVSPWSTPWSVWLDKTGTFPSTFVGNEATRWGTALEPLIADRFAEEHPEFQVVERPVLLRSDSHPHMIGNPDRFLIDERGRVGILEIKTTSAWLADEWEGEDLPLHAYFQALHYWHLVGAEFAFAAVLIGGQRYEERHVPWSADVVAEMLERQAEFWACVESGTPPRKMAADTEAVCERWPVDLSETVELDDEARRLIPDLRDAQSRAKFYDDSATAAKNELRDMLGDAKVGTLDGIPVVSWKSNATGSRVLRILKAAGSL